MCLAELYRGVGQTLAYESSFVMGSFLLGAAILAALPYFIRLEADYLLRLDRGRFQEEMKVKTRIIPETYDFVIGNHIF